MKTSQAVAVPVITCAERRSPIECGGTGSRRSAAAIRMPTQANTRRTQHQRQPGTDVKNPMRSSVPIES